MKNAGKIFEESIKNSMPNYTLLVRLNDSPQAFKQSKLTRFTPRTPFDYICFDTSSKILYCLELKSTSGKSISFEDIYSDEKENRMIHKHQTKSLLEYSKYNNVVAGFLFNFRHFEGSPDYNEMTYFMEVNNFQRMCDKIGKKSFNEVDALLNGAIKVQGVKKRVRYSWDINEFLENMSKEYE